MALHAVCVSGVQDVCEVCVLAVCEMGRGDVCFRYVKCMLGVCEVCVSGV